MLLPDDGGGAGGGGGSATGGVPGSEGGRREKRPTCEFCGCRLTSDGEVTQMSEKAKDILKLEDKITALEREKTSLEGTITTLRTDLEAARALRDTPAPRKGFLVSK